MTENLGSKLFVMLRACASRRLEARTGGTRRVPARLTRMNHALLTDIVGTLAGVCGIIGFTPQIAKIIREKDASAVSAKMYAVTTTGFVLWVTFGVLQKSWPIIVSNGIMMGLAATILMLKLRDEKRA
jgi:MtN3 and saliva related transmembrane protein